MNHSEHRQLQQTILDQVLYILKNDPHVSGILLAGSYARGEQDAFSDLDLACYLRDEQLTGRVELYEQISQVAPVLCRLWIYDLNALFLYENGVRLDLDFCKPSMLGDPSKVYISSVIEYDPDGVLRKAVPEHSKTFGPARHPRWFEPGDPTMLDWFFWMFRQVVCWAKRGAQGDYRSFDKLTNAIHSLEEIRTRLAEMRLWTLGENDYLLRADPECARRLMLTYPHMEAGEIIHSTKLLLAEYEMICPAYCQKSGATYPERKVQITRQLIAEYEQLP